MPLRYSPPKRQGWGHTVSHLSATQLYELGSTFLRDQTIPIRSLQPDMTIVWDMSASNPVSDDIPLLPPPTDDAAEDVTIAESHARVIRRITRKFDASVLPQALEWLYRIEAKTADWDGLLSVGFHHSVCFQWIGFPPTLASSSLGFHFGSPRGLTTQFTFDSVLHYRSVQRYLRELGLVTLRDTHIRPKDALASSGRNAA